MARGGGGCADSGGGCNKWRLGAGLCRVGAGFLLTAGVVVISRVSAPHYVALALLTRAGMVEGGACGPRRGVVLTAAGMEVGGVCGPRRRVVLTGAGVVINGVSAQDYVALGRGFC